MACGCTASKKDTTTQTVAAAPTVLATNGDCPFTKEQCAEWLVRVQCVRDNGFYTQFNMTLYDVNLYIGVLMSVGNYGGSPCFFDYELREIQNFIMILTANNICPTS